MRIFQPGGSRTPYICLRSSYIDKLIGNLIGGWILKHRIGKHYVGQIRRWYRMTSPAVRLTMMLSEGRDLSDPLSLRHRRHGYPERFLFQLLQPFPYNKLEYSEMWPPLNSYLKLTLILLKVIDMSHYTSHISSSPIGNPKGRVSKDPRLHTNERTVKLISWREGRFHRRRYCCYRSAWIFRFSSRKTREEIPRRQNWFASKGLQL